MASIQSRRDFMKTASLGSAALSLAGPGWGRKAFADRASDPRPNILFILADDLGYGDLGCFGQQSIRTPQLDAMASEGVRFTQCYAGCTVCAPSRSVLMTGLHTGHTRVRGNKSDVGGVPPEGRVSLEPGDFTVAELLRAAGYRTGITGKWGLGEPGTPGIPNLQGFDEWFGYLNQAHAHSYYPDYLWHNRERMALEDNRDGQRKQYTHDLFTEFALEFVRKHREEPFFLYLPWTIPHDALEVPDLGPYAHEEWPENAKTYAAMVSRMDADVGQILTLLKELDLDEKTIVFFCSDNGAARRWDGVFDSSGSLRGNKRDLYEGGIRTPMIVRWPGMVAAGRTDETPWYFADFLPTAASLAGILPLAGIDGVSVAPTLLGEKQDLFDRVLYWEFYEGGFKQAARHQVWKAVRNGLDQPIELYDLASDPGEDRDIASTHPWIVERFEEVFRESHVESPLWPTGKA